MPSINKAIVLHAVVPVRAAAAEEAEQTTQLLFAQTVSVLESQPRWLLIRNDDDNQEGWVDRKMLSPLSSDEWQAFRAARKDAMVAMPVTYAVSENNGQTIPLSLGTTLPDYQDGRFSLLGVSFRIDPMMIIERPLELTEANLQRVCRFLLNVPYLWGGKNGLGMDCSGMTQQVMKLFGFRLPRNASQQAKEGRAVAFDEAKAGDLAFFCHTPQEGGPALDEANPRVTHVGLMLNSNTLIHCSGRVKLETITAEGLPTHRLLALRRL